MRDLPPGDHRLNSKRADVAIIMGSQSDWATMRHAAETLDALGVSHDTRIVSAHRTPDRLYEFAKGAKAAGYKIIIAGAGGAAHLPGMAAALTPLPVFGVPVESKALSGQDSLLSIVQMPAGIPVGTLAIGRAGAVNAALLAAAVLALVRPGARQAARLLPRRADREGRRRAFRRAMTALPARCRRARRSASSAAASSGACWRWPPRASATAPSSSSRRPTARPRSSPTGRSSPPMTIRRRSPNWQRLSAVVTYEFENVPVAAATPLAAGRPGLAAAQGAGGQPGPAGRKALPERHRHIHSGFPSCGQRRRPGVGALRLRRQRRAEDLPHGLRRQGPARVPRFRRRRRRHLRRHGRRAADPRSRWSAFEREISVIAARGRDGALAAYDPAENVHRDGILHTSTVPAAVSPATAELACRNAFAILEALDYVGVVGVEFFALGDGSLLVNEIAPRVHNSGHWTEAACAVSQFEQHIRAIAGLPLGDTARHSDCVMENLIGDDVERAHGPARRAGPRAAPLRQGRGPARPQDGPFHAHYRPRAS